MHFSNTIKVLVALVIMVATLSACGEHNKPAPNKGKNLDSERIYGNKGGDPIQLPNENEDPADINARANAIREKMYAPKSVSQFESAQTAAQEEDTTQMEAKTAESAENMEEAATSEEHTAQEQSSEETETAAH